MTVIAWDGQTLAADRRSVSGGLRRVVTKLRRIGDKRIGYAGPVDAGEAMLAWIEAGEAPNEFPASQRDKDEWAAVLVIGADRSIVMYERTPSQLRFHDPIFAIGSGRDFALAAMHLGNSAAEAVAVASHFQIDCGDGVDVLE